MTAHFWIHISSDTMMGDSDDELNEDLRQGPLYADGKILAKTKRGYLGKCKHFCHFLATKYPDFFINEDVITDWRH
jgi:hypothetical protein